ncbi:aryl-sulfate sulfotransferase [bacterium]|nr:aryl-sulfate sulfotransferase [bacterium]
MKKAFVFCWLIISNAAFCWKLPENVIYLHPKPDAVNISTKTGIILRFDPVLQDQLSLNDFSMTVAGENSGIQQGKMVLSDNNVLFQLNNAYTPGEKVYVSIQCEKLGWTSPYQYQFSVNTYLSLSKQTRQIAPTMTSSLSKKSGSQVKVINGVSVPSDFPLWEVAVLEDGMAPGKIFITNYMGDPSYIMILENNGIPYFYQRMEQNLFSYFTIQPSGELSRGEISQFAVLDSNCTVKRYAECGFGYVSNGHEFLILSDGHYFMIAHNIIKVDMSKIVTGGEQDAGIMDTSIQEFDEDGNVIFVWLCSEYFDITEAVYEDLTDSFIQYVHTNSIAIDYDGHIIASHRHLNQVTKINRQTGDIIWRLGGKNNDFNFVNDELRISYQHDARPVPRKPNHYTIFDNGNNRKPRCSRAVEFKLDVENKTATRVWEYRLPKGNSTALGNAQRLPNGNTHINWGRGEGAKATEVTPDGKVVYQADFANENWVYRSFRFEWEHVYEKPYLIVEKMPFNIDLIFNKFGDKTVKEYQVYGGQSMNDLEQLAVTSNTFYQLTSNDLENNRDYYFQVKAVHENGSLSASSNTEKVRVFFPEPGINLVRNGDFSQELDNFWELWIDPDSGYGEIMIDSNEQLHFKIVDGVSDYINIAVSQNNIPLYAGQTYLFEFDAYADSPRIFEAELFNNDNLNINYSKIGPISLTTRKEHFEYEFTMKNTNDMQACIMLDASFDDTDFYVDNVSLLIIGNVAIKQETNNQPGHVKLCHNFPNPFNPATKIAYNLPKSANVSLKIYNLSGQEVETLVNTFQPAGEYKIMWQPRSLASGIYFYKLQAGAFSETKKLILQK